MLLLSFLQLHTKIRASHYLVNIMEEVQFVSSNIELAFEQCSCMWSDVGGTQHETIYLLIIKSIYFMNSYLECTVRDFFLMKSENSLVHGLFHNCSFMHKLLIISCTGTCPVCAVNMSVHLMTAFPLKLSVTNSWNGVSFSGMNILWTIINMYLSRNVSLRKNIVNLEAKLLLTNVWPFVFFFFFFFLVGQPARFFWGL